MNSLSLHWATRQPVNVQHKPITVRPLWHQLLLCWLTSPVAGHVYVHGRCVVLAEKIHWDHLVMVPKCGTAMLWQNQLWHHFLEPSVQPLTCHLPTLSFFCFIWEKKVMPFVSKGLCNLEKHLPGSTHGISLILWPLPHGKPRNHRKPPSQHWPFTLCPLDMFKCPIYCLKMHFITEKYLHYCHVFIIYDSK